MGIPQLWDVIKSEDHIVLTSKLAEDFFQEHGRPMRIAVDEADWVHNNVTKEKVADIRRRSGQPYRGEKNIFWRICDLLRLNIHLLFIFDSPQRPPKRTRRHHTKLNPKDTECLRAVLDGFRIPYHQAKGEAEAECVRLQQLGVVDAVWSQDSDCLLFGCEFLIHDNRVAKDPKASNTTRAKGDTKKDNSTLKVVRGTEIQEKHGLTRDGLLLFAMLCGGDFNPGGLKNCGVGLAVRAVQDGMGQGLSLCQTQDDCVGWRSGFSAWLGNQEKSRDVQVPRNFPDIQVLAKYNTPTVHPDGELMTLRGLCERPINEPELFAVTGPFFNLFGKGYLKWIGPILLTRWLMRRDPSLPREHTHQIELVRQRATKRESPASEPLPPTLKCRFSPFGLTSLDKRYLQGNWIGETTRDQTPFDPNFVVECEIPAYLLERVLPSESFHCTPKVPRKRMRTEEHAMAEKRPRTTAPAPQYPVAGSASRQSDYIDLGSDSEDDLTSLHQDLSRSEIVDRMLEPSDLGDEAEQLRQAIALSLEPPVSARDQSTLHTPPRSRSLDSKKESESRVRPVDMIRAARLEFFDHPKTTTLTQAIPQRDSSNLGTGKKGLGSNGNSRAKSPEIIDLTI